MASSYFVRELECGGKTLQIKQLYVGDVGCVVWDAAIVLCKFLENCEFFPSGYWNGKRVMDIGSGTGVAGLAAAVLGSGVVGISMFDALLLLEYLNQTDFWVYYIYIYIWLMDDIAKPLTIVS